MMQDFTPDGVRIPERRVLAESVYDAIKGLLLEQRIAPGAVVNMDRLARSLRVSPTPVREALARLEAEGLVKKEPLRSYTVTPMLDEDGFFRLYEARLLIEPFAAGLAAVRADGRDRAELAATQAAMKGADVGGRYAEFKTYSALDAHFHELVVAAGRNEFLLDAFRHLHVHVHTSRVYFPRRAPRKHPGEPEHDRIVDAVRRGDGADAEEAMRDHVSRSWERVRFSLVEPPAGTAPACAGGD
jgi:DNA-binding GntR family transcriptional regulator